MNEIEKLEKIITALEEQATDVIEFHKILKAVNLAVNEIEESKYFIKINIKNQEEISENTRRFANDSYEKFERINELIQVTKDYQIKLESKIDSTISAQIETIRIIGNLDALTSKKYKESLTDSEIKSKQISENLIFEINRTQNSQENTNSLIKIILALTITNIIATLALFTKFL